MQDFLISRSSRSSHHDAVASIPDDVAGRRNPRKSDTFFQALAYLEPLLKKQNLKASFVGPGQAAATRGGFDSHRVAEIHIFRRPPCG